MRHCRLPGTPLGNTGLSWSDVLLGNLPNVYIYAGAPCTVGGRCSVICMHRFRRVLCSRRESMHQFNDLIGRLLCCSCSQTPTLTWSHAANNPSESIIAKRRGYGTIVSHNVPPYGRAGLYKQLAELQSMVTEYREDPEGNQVLRRPILAALQSAGAFIPSNPALDPYLTGFWARPACARSQHCFLSRAPSSPAGFEYVPF